MSPYGPSTTAATATRGSSRSHITRRPLPPGSRTGERTRAGASRSTCQDSTGWAETSPTPYARGAAASSASVAARQLPPGVPMSAGDEAPVGGARARGHLGDQVQARRARLAAVDLLQREHVGVQVGGGGRSRAASTRPSEATCRSGRSTWPGAPARR